MLGRKDKLCDRVEGGLNTSVLMTPCWDHLFPDKRAQGWKKKRNLRQQGGVCSWWRAGDGDEMCECTDR